MSPLFGDTFGRNVFGGMDVFVSHPQPKIRLSERVPCSDDFRRDFNAWLVSFFGFQESPVPKHGALVFGNNMIVRPETMVLLRNMT